MTINLLSNPETEQEQPHMYDVGLRITTFLTVKYDTSLGRSFSWSYKKCQKRKGDVPWNKIWKATEADFLT